MDFHLRFIQFYHDALLLVSLFGDALFGRQDDDGDDLCGMEVQRWDDLSIAASAVSVEEEDTWETVNKLRRRGVFRPDSWTIHIYDRSHQAGDTVWCRIWNNDSNDFCEYEDSEILKVVRLIIILVPKAYFYVQTVESGVSLFESNLILRVLTTILNGAKKQDGITIPSKEDLQVPLRNEKRGFLASLRFRAQAAGNH